MDRRLFPLAELAACAGILAGGYTIVGSGKAAVVTAEGSEARESRETVREAAAPEPVAKPATARTAPTATGRPPVPLLLTPRSPPASDAARPVEATANAPVAGQTDAAGPADMTEQANKKVSSDAAAKAMIEADGYRSVRSVTKAPDGLWRGVAMRGTVEVAVSVDSDGNVTAQ